MRTGLLTTSIATGLMLAVSAASIAEDYYCVPIETAVLANRTHVRCSEPIFVRYGYPQDPPGSGQAISYFAVPLSNPAWARRFIQTVDLAQTTGLTLRFSYTSGDTSGTAFGCAAADCRTPWAIGLVKAPPPWPPIEVFSDNFESGDLSFWSVP